MNALRFWLAVCAVAIVLASLLHFARVPAFGITWWLFMVSGHLCAELALALLGQFQEPTRVAGEHEDPEQIVVTWPLAITGCGALVGAGVLLFSALRPMGWAL